MTTVTTAGGGRGQVPSGQRGGAGQGVEPGSLDVRAADAEELDRPETCKLTWVA
jgi:hypothetical protein